MANLHGKGNLNNLSKAMLLMNDAYKSALAEKKQVYADEFRLSIDLFGDANHFGLLVISDSRDKTFNPVPQASIPLEKATPEAIGAAVAEYIRENCSEK